MRGSIKRPKLVTRQWQKTYSEPSSAVRLAREQHRPVLLVLSYGPGDYAVGDSREVAPGVRIEHLARFEGAIVPTENYYVYRVTTNDQAPADGR